MSKTKLYLQGTYNVNGKGQYSVANCLVTYYTQTSCIDNKDDMSQFFFLRGSGFLISIYVSNKKHISEIVILGCAARSS